VRAARGHRDAALVDLADALDAAVEQRIDACIALAAKGASWLGAPPDATTARVLRGAVVHARVIGSTGLEGDARAACGALGVDPDGGDVRVELEGEVVDLTERTAPRPDGARWLDALLALTRAYDLRGRLAGQASPTSARSASAGEGARASTPASTPPSAPNASER
jgi:hypothetical protein